MWEWFENKPLAAPTHSKNDRICRDFGSFWWKSLCTIELCILCRKPGNGRFKSILQCVITVHNCSIFHIIPLLFFRLAQELQTLKESHEELEFAKLQGLSTDSNPGRPHLLAALIVQLCALPTIYPVVYSPGGITSSFPVKCQKNWPNWAPVCNCCQHASSTLQCLVFTQCASVSSSESAHVSHFSQWLTCYGRTLLWFPFSCHFFFWA